MRRAALAIILAASLAGCAGRSGPTLSAVTAQIAPPEPGTARIVVLREKAYHGLYDRAWPIKLDGEPMGDLKTGTFAYRDRPAGHHEVSLDLWDFPGTSRFAFDASDGQTYFLVAKLNSNNTALMAGVLLGGLVGWGIAAAAVDRSGPVDFVLVDDAEARAALSELQLAE